MPTAHVPPGGAAKAAPVDPASAPTTFNPTTFSPKTQMPTARAPTQVDAADAAPAVAPSRPAPLAPAAAAPQTRGDFSASRPAAPPSGFAASSSFGAPTGPASRPAPAAVPAAVAADAAAGPSRRTWQAVAVGAAVVAVAAFAAWHFSARNGDVTGASAAASAAAASAALAAASGSLPGAVAPTLQTAGAISPPPSLPAESNETEIVLSSSSALPDAASSPRVRPQGKPVPRVEDPATAATAMPAQGARNADFLPPATTLGTTAADRQRANAREPVAALKPPPAVVDNEARNETRAEPRTAREACGNRNFFSLAVCMDERCELPRYRATAECIPILARKAERANR